jgi:ribonuclease D
MPVVGIPNHRNWSQRYPDAAARLTAAKEVVMQVSIAVSVPAENVLKPDTMRALCFTPPAPLELESLVGALLDLGARHWQIELIASGFLEALAKVASPDQKSTDSNEGEISDDSGQEG